MRRREYRTWCSNCATRRADSRHLLWHAGARATARRSRAEFAETRVRSRAHSRVERDRRLLSDLPSLSDDELDVWMSHGDKVVELPHGFVPIASTASAPIAAMESQATVHLRGAVPSGSHAYDRRIGDHSPLRARHLRLHRHCGRRRTSSPTQSRRCAKQVGDEKVVLGLSGGVDSSVVAALLSRAIGDQLTCVFVDHGLLRLGEREEVEATFTASNALNLNLVCVDAARGISRQSARRRGPGSQTQDHRRDVHRRIRSRSAQESTA